MALRFSIPGLQVTRVVVSPRVKEATVGWVKAVGGATVGAAEAGLGEVNEDLTPTLLG